MYPRWIVLKMNFLRIFCEFYSKLSLCPTMDLKKNFKFQIDLRRLFPPIATKYKGARVRNRHTSPHHLPVSHVFYILKFTLSFKRRSNRIEYLLLCHIHYLIYTIILDFISRTRRVLHYPYVR